MELKKHPELMKLERENPIGDLTLQTIDGMRWKNRMQASDAYFSDYVKRFGWTENQELLTEFKKMADKFGTYIALPYAIGQNLIADTYYRNPDPLIQDKGGDRDLSKILTDVARAIHAETDSERKMKEAFGDRWWAGFGCVWASFRQHAYVDESIYDFVTGQNGALVPTKQEVLLKRISPWRIRFDPEGREWDLSDHAYVAIDYYMTLAAIMRSPRFTDVDKKRVMAFYQTGLMAQQVRAANVRYATLTSFKEEDPEYIRVPMRQIWARPEKMIYDMPLGADFTMEPQAWPDEFAEANIFPLQYMAKNKESEDEANLCGFIGVPDMTLIKPLILEIHKMWALFLAANQHVINKYLMPKGALDDTAKAKLRDGVRQFEVIEWDKDALNAFPTEQRDKIGPSDILTQVPRADLKEIYHLTGIDKAMDMIAQIIGQGPAERGGQSEADTATESLGIQRGMERRRKSGMHADGRHYAGLTKIIFIILKARQTLPVRYQMTTRNFNERAWASFNADKLKTLDLHFDYAVGSSEPRTPAEEFALRERVAAILMPIFQARGDFRLMLKVARDLVEPLNVQGAEEYFNDEVITMMKELLAIMRGLDTGQLMADDQRVAAKIPELVSQIAQQILTQQDLIEVEAAAAGAPAPAPEGEGSLPAAPTPGQADHASAAAGSAAAGIGGGVAN